MMDLHKTFAHFSPVMLRRLLAIRPKLKELLTNRTGIITCNDCIKGKLTKGPHNTIHRPLVKPLEVLSTDIAGPLPRSKSGNKYFGVIFDSSTKHISAIPAVTRSDICKKIVETVRREEKSSGLSVKRINSDGAPELTEGAPRRFANSTGSTLSKTTPDAPASNGQAERAIRTLKNCIRVQLSSANLLNNLWDQALYDCSAKYNATPRAIAPRTPYYNLFSKQASIPLIQFGAQGAIPDKSSYKPALADRSLSRRYLSPQSDSLISVLGNIGKLLTARLKDFVFQKSSLVKSLDEKTLRKQSGKVTKTPTLASTRVLRDRSRLSVPKRFREQEPSSTAAAISVDRDLRVAPPPNPKSLRATRKKMSMPFSQIAGTCHTIHSSTE